MEKEPYNQRDHEHCWNQKVPACGIDKASHKVCCLCEKPMENKETNYCDSRTNEERERDSKIEVTMTTTNNDEEKKWIQKVCPKCITLTLVQEPRIVSYCEKCGTELDLSKPVVEKKCTHGVAAELETSGTGTLCTKCGCIILSTTTKSVEKSGWEEELPKECFGAINLDNPYAVSKIKDFIKNVEKEAYERGIDKGMGLNLVQSRHEARLEGKKEAEVALIAELEVMKREDAKLGSSTFERDNYFFNLALDLIISNLRERIQ